MLLRFSLNSNTTLSLRFTSTAFVFPKYRSNFYKYPEVLEQRNHQLNPHLIVFSCKYCLSDERPLNLVVCSSILCSSSSGNASIRAALKWSIIDRMFYPLFD